MTADRTTDSLSASEPDPAPEGAAPKAPPTQAQAPAAAPKSQKALPEPPKITKRVQEFQPEFQPCCDSRPRRLQPGNTDEALTISNREEERIIGE